MKTLALALVILSLSTACSEYTLAELVNTSTNITPETCIYITDENITINVPSVQTGGETNMTAYQETTDPVSATLYRCNYDIIGQSHSLTFNESYRNAEHDLNITCPAFPKINAVINQTAGTSYTNDQYNLTVIAQHQAINHAYKLNFSENYSNPTLNLNVTCPAYPKLNKAENLSYNGTYRDELGNTTITCPIYPRADESTNLNCGQSKDYPLFGIHVAAPVCYNIDKDMDYGERIDIPESNIHLRAPAKINKILNLSNNQSFADEKAGLNITCLPSQADFLGFCTMLNNTDIPQVWRIINDSNIMGNYTYWASIPLDNLSPSCTLEEKFGGRPGFISCWNRNIEGMQMACQNFQDDANKWRTEFMTLNASFSNGAKTAEGNSDFASKIIGGGLATVAVFLLGNLYVNRKNNEKRGQV